MCSVPTEARQILTWRTPFVEQGASFDVCAVVTMATATHIGHCLSMKVCVLAAGWRHGGAGLTHDVHL